jgi:trans-aconitate 2-methyltransferase
MGVATHLGIDLADYDARIRTFIPDYETMLAAAAAVVPERSRTIVDLGTGTGALAARCLEHAPNAQIVGIDADGEILMAARERLGSRANFVNQSFLRAPLPPCDAVVASFALHHVRTRPAKAALYRRVRRALRPRGVFVNVDCQPASARTLAAQQRDAWRAHLRNAYAPPKADALLQAWGKEDVYVPLDAEMALLRRAGFGVEIVWRNGSFAVMAATSASSRR